MAFKVLAGPYLNHLTRVASTPTLSPTAVTGFPVTNLYDNRASLPTYFSGSTGTAATITCDMNLVPGGTFETASDEDYWTILGSGNNSRSTTGPYAGSANLQITPSTSAAGAIAVQDITVRSGEALTFTAAARPITTATTAYVKVRNRQTGKFLTSTGGWTASTGGYATGASVVTNATTSAYSFQSVSFSVEDLTTCKTDTVSLRLYCWAKGTAAADFDSVLLWPTTDWCSVHGHNLSAFITPTLQYSTSTSTWDDAVTLTVLRDSFYTSLSSSGEITSRYVRLSLDGAVDQAGALPYMGELVLGQSESLLQNPNYGGAVAWTERQTRLQSSIGDQWVYLHGGRPVRSVAMSFNLSSTAEYDQVYRTLFRGSRGGSNLICLAPTEQESQTVILGRIREALTIEKRTASLYGVELEVTESPLPSLTAQTDAADSSITT